MKSLLDYVIVFFQFLYSQGGEQRKLFHRINHQFGRVTNEWFIDDFFKNRVNHVHVNDQEFTEAASGYPVCTLLDSNSNSNAHLFDVTISVCFLFIH